ncbi:MAG: ParB N-terminal domain-containing protein [Candidatus Korarchaeum sp.]
MRAVLLRISVLRVHEMTERERIKEIKGDILREGKLRRPILADGRTMIVIDGHHRLQALRELGCEFIPVVLVDYGSDDICVEAWRDDCSISKEDVIRVA